MTEKNITYHDPDAPENLSSEELADRIEEEKKNARRSLRLAVTALIALIAVALAWFVASTIVSGRSSSIEAQNDVSFELASTGQRQTAEQSKLQNMLQEGQKKEFTKYRTTSYTSGTNGKTVYTATDRDSEFSKKTTLYTGSSNLAWYLNGQVGLAPGSSGKLDFYLIPRKDGLITATVSLDLTPYIENGNKAEASTTENLKALVDGHLLMFASLDDENGYTGWLEVGTNKAASFTVNAPAGKTFAKDIPYKVTVRWVWPQYFHNYIYKQRSREGDLFTEYTDAEQYNAFINAVNNSESLGSRLFYDKEKKDIVKVSANTKLDNNMLEQTRNSYSEYYNQADEYIGTNAKYVYIELKVN